jgi:hypothetical protein
MAPYELPALPLVEVAPAAVAAAPTPSESAKPVGMSLPMA